MKRLSVVVPCFNEEGNLDRLALRVLAAPAPEGWTLSLLLVDDGSHDGTWARIRALACDGRVAGVRLERNGGVQKAVLAGLSAAGGDAAAVMDADLQDPPEQLASMLRSLEECGADAVVGLKAVRRDSAPLLASAKALAMSVLPFRRGEGDFCVLARPCLERLLRCGRESTPFRVRRQWALRGRPVVYASYEREARRAGRSAFNWRSLGKLWLLMLAELLRGPVPALRPAPAFRETLGTP